MPQKFRLTASTIASYFKHRCDRLFRWKTVETRFRGRSGIGWNVPRDIRSHSRPGIALLMEAGDTFELERVNELIAEVGEAQVKHQGFGEVRGRQQILPMPSATFLQTLQERPLPRYIAQIEIDPNALPGFEAHFLRRFSLDPNTIYLGPARPDLIELIPAADNSENRYRLRIWDFKASQSARHEHFIQVAYYSFLLETVLELAHLTDTFETDIEFAVIRSRDGIEEFELAPYRLAVADFLTHRAPTILKTPAADAHFHVHEKCALCEYLETCRTEADAHYDLSRIAYMRSESKRRLRQAGIKTHRELAQITQESNGDQITNLRSLSHDLSNNLIRYMTSAKTLEDGQRRPLETSTLLMPRYENVRIVLSAEQDPVTNTCFALGIKTYEGWNEGNNQPLGNEEIFISSSPDREADILLRFLQTLNELLIRIDSQNQTLSDQPVETDPRVVAASQRQETAQRIHAQFKAKNPRLYKANLEHAPVIAQRDTLAQEAKQADRELKQIIRDVQWERRTQQTTVHFYVYDNLDVLVLKSLIERYLFDSTPELLAEIRNLVRLFPPESILPDAETFRSIPGTIVTQVLRNLVALPIPYLYDLRSVSEMYQPTDQSGQEKGFRFLPRYGFGWSHSNQVAFERIHDVWNSESFTPDARHPDRVLSPVEILQTIEQTVRNKLRATDSVVRAIRQDLGDYLLLRKEPFRLFTDFDPLDFQMLEALRIFTILEASLEEMAVKHLHTLPAEDRISKFECIRGLRYLTDRNTGDNSLWFTFDPGSRDAKFDVGDFNLVLTPENEPQRLLGDVDGRLFDESRWRHDPYKVTLEEYDPSVNPPQLRLKPDKLDKFRQRFDPDGVYVLDRLYVDYNSPKVRTILHRLHSAPQQARHIHDLLGTVSSTNWQPFVDDVNAIEELLKQQVAQSGRDPQGFLNAGQWHTFRGVFQSPLTLIWGPPGTGKTYMLGHILLGYMLAARQKERPLRILVTAFTHHAIGNVLKKASDLANHYGLAGNELVIAKAHGTHPHRADDLLPEQVERVYDGEIANFLNRNTPCLVVGSTVWGIFKAMKNAGESVQSWFDVIIVDEASQMKLSDALIALSASKPEANIILAGDDRQLPPIIHGTYPEEHEYMLTSIFAFMRYRMEQQKEHQPDIEQRMLFLLEDNFRMNEPLTAYPREVLYQGRFFSQQPNIKIATTPALSENTDDPIDFMLYPERPVVLCWYSSPVSFTARNPLEADLVARLANRLSEILTDEQTGQPFTHNQFAQTGLAILSPHRAQNSTIRQVLATYGFNGTDKALPLVDTVDKLQGQERDVVLVSYGVADEEYAEAEAEFLLSSNRFNVATTRPRQKLIVFCSESVLNVVPDDHRILLDSMMLKEFRRYCSDGLIQFIWTTPEFGNVVLNVQWKGFTRQE